MNRRLLLLPAAFGLAALGVLAAPAQPASAHPLGNFSVNQYAGLTLGPDRVDVAAVVDTAELPTVQERSTVDSDGDGTVSDAERTAYAASSCREVAGQFEVRAGHDRLKWTVTAGSFAYAPGAGGLQTSRLTCGLSAPAQLARATTVSVVNHYRTDRVGWRELTATGAGVRLVDPPIPATSVSDELRAYPADLLSSALDQRSATLRVAPGTGAATAAKAGPTPGGDAFTRWTATAERFFQQVAGGRLTPLVTVLAILLAIVLGAGHAILPGHGKTVLAAYLAGRRGRPRDAIAVGATVTLTHTGAVLVVGLMLSTSTALVGDKLLGYLGLVSGVLVTAVGTGMLVGLARHRHQHHHGHAHDHHHHHGHGKLGLAGIGLAGGLVPSPSALVVLLGAIGLGRAAFGVLLVVAYGFGMAATLTGAGLLLLKVQHRLPTLPRLRGSGRAITAGLVVLVGLGLAARAAAGVV